MPAIFGELSAFQWALRRWPTREKWLGVRAEEELDRLVPRAEGSAEYHFGAPAEGIAALST